MTKQKDNLIEVPFTREMLNAQCIQKALDSVLEMESVIVLARNKDGDVLMWHSYDSRAELIDIMEECKYAIYGGDFFDV
jgi:hypothetical protein